MTEQQIKKFMDKFGAEYNKETGEYKLCVSGCINVPKKELKKKGVGRNTLIALVDTVIDAVAEEGNRKTEWIRDNF